MSSLSKPLDGFQCVGHVPQSKVGPRSPGVRTQGGDETRRTDSNRKGARHRERFGDVFLFIMELRIIVCEVC